MSTPVSMTHTVMSLPDKPSFCAASTCTCDNQQRIAHQNCNGTSCSCIGYRLHWGRVSVMPLLLLTCSCITECR
jgi:hypothetical protein